MERENMERTFCWKISAELKGFEYRMKQKDKDEIYASAYEIDCTIRIYEKLIELCERLEIGQLQECMKICSLLSFLYEQWLKSDTGELEEVIERSLMESIAKVALEGEEDYEEINFYSGIIKRGMVRLAAYGNRRF